MDCRALVRPDKKVPPEVVAVGGDLLDPDSLTAAVAGVSRSSTSPRCSAPPKRTKSGRSTCEAPITSSAPSNNTLPAAWSATPARRRGPFGDDARIAAVIGELILRSPAFVSYWARRDVHPHQQEQASPVPEPRSTGRVGDQHPRHQAFTVTGAPANSSSSTPPLRAVLRAGGSFGPADALRRRFLPLGVRRSAQAGSVREGQGSCAPGVRMARRLSTIQAR